MNRILRRVLLLVSVYVVGTLMVFRKNPPVSYINPTTGLLYVIYAIASLFLYRHKGLAYYGLAVVAAMVISIFIGVVGGNFSLIAVIVDGILCIALGYYNIRIIKQRKAEEAED